MTIGRAVIADLKAVVALRNEAAHGLIRNLTTA